MINSEETFVSVAVPCAMEDATWILYIAMLGDVWADMVAHWKIFQSTVRISDLNPIYLGKMAR